MDTFKSVFFKPDPKEQKRKCDSLIRKSRRQIDRQIQDQTNARRKAEAQIRADFRRAEKNPSQRKQALQRVRQLAKESAGVRKSINRLNTNKAQLDSIQMQVNETFALKKIQTSLRDSTTVMKNVNSLIRLPELAGTMNELSQELMKAGVIEEMVDDMLPGEELEEDGLDESEAEINKIIADALGKEKDKYLEQSEEAFPEAPSQIEEPSNEVSEQDIANMRMKLEALRS